MLTTMRQETLAASARPVQRAQRQSRRSWAPSPRAAVGSLLVMFAIAATFLAINHDSQTRLTRYVVLTRPVAAGASLSINDLGLAPMDLVAETKATAFTDPSEVIGKSLSTASPAGSLVSAGLLVNRTLDPSEARRLTLSLEPSHALNGALTQGDRVDIISVDEHKQASAVVTNAVIESVEGSNSQSVGGSSDYSITLIVGSTQQATKVIQAHALNSVTLISSAPGPVDSQATGPT